MLHLILTIVTGGSRYFTIPMQVGKPRCEWVGEITYPGSWWEPGFELKSAWLQGPHVSPLGLGFLPITHTYKCLALIQKWACGLWWTFPYCLSCSPPLYKIQFPVSLLHGLRLISGWEQFKCTTIKSSPADKESVSRLSKARFPSLKTQPAPSLRHTSFSQAIHKASSAQNETTAPGDCQPKQIGHMEIRNLIITFCGSSRPHSSCGICWR